MVGSRSRILLYAFRLGGLESAIGNPPCRRNSVKLVYEKSALLNQAVRVNQHKNKVKLIECQETWASDPPPRLISPCYFWTAS